MSEFMLTDVATAWPGTCAGCGGTKGPFLNTHRILGGNHVYWCPSCSRKDARARGYLKGDRMDELSNAAAAVHERDMEILSLREQVTWGAEKMEDLTRQIRELSDELKDVKAHAARLETEIRRAAENTLAAVTG